MRVPDSAVFPVDAQAGAQGWRKQPVTGGGIVSSWRA